MGMPELEVSFDLRDDRHYGVQFRFEGLHEQAAPREEVFDVEFDWEGLQQLAGNPRQYGRVLSDMLFREAGAKKCFLEAKAAAQGVMRIRISLGPATPKLHDVLWESLASPESGAPLSLDESLPISRFLSSWQFRPVQLRRRDELKAVVAIASPRGLENQHAGGRDLPPIDVNAEWTRASASLGEIPAKLLAGGGRASVDHIVGELREGADILYLVCHGALVKGQPLLWLEDEEGNVARVPGVDLELRLKDMLVPPRLVVLASCESAGAGGERGSNDEGALASLASRLAAAGVPAVIAMQHSVTVDTAASFFSTFFRELRRDGQIDRAVSVARSAVRNRPDWWVPVLITRLKRGRLWFEHDSLSPRSFGQWNGIMSDIGAAACTPILGPDLVASMFGKPVQIARRWSERYDFPMASSDRESLPQVAQYLSYHQNTAFPKEELRRYSREFLLKAFPEQTENLNSARLTDLITQVGKHLRSTNAKEIHKRLAALPLPIYINTNRDDLLRDALLQEGKDPQVEVCRWFVFEEDGREWPESIFSREPKYRPTVKRPLVFHVFGNIRWPDTLVLTEDDYFSYLIGVNKNQRSVFGSRSRETGKDPLPQVVVNALTNRGLLFLGFRTSDWEFRTLFRAIRAFEGQRTRPKHTSVAVQLEPQQEDYLEPLGARNYIERYFRDYKYELFWGGTEDFVDQLCDQWVRNGRPVPDEDLLARA
jgi:CHAT domain-containing protein/SIR2-like protein